MVHGAIKSGAAISGKLPEWYMIHISPCIRGKYTLAYKMIKTDRRCYNCAWKRAMDPPIQKYIIISDLDTSMLNRINYIWRLQIAMDIN